MGKHVLLNLEHSRQIHFHIRIDDLHMIPKRIAGMSRVIHNISSDVAAPLLGYNTVILPKCMNGVTALLLVNYVTQSVNFPTETCH